jgi:hypothetical protein
MPRWARRRRDEIGLIAFSDTFDARGSHKETIVNAFQAALVGGIG